LRALIQGLERGETVLLYCDRAPRLDGPRIPLPFLGTQVWGARGAGWLRRRTGADLLPVALLWEGRDGHHLHIDPEIACGRGGAAGDADAMRAVYGALEKYARRHPEQWLKWVELGGMLAT
jgi:lauroyl/myristoyl acyltransferase